MKFTHCEINRRQRGVTLLEALVALVVLSLGLLGIAKLNAYLVATAGQSKARMEAMALAEQKFEELRNQILETEQYKTVFTSANFALYSQTTMDDSAKVKCNDAAQSDSPPGLLASYTRSWCSLGTSMKNQVLIYVVWKDAANVKQSVALQSVIAWDSPLKSVAFASEQGNPVAGTFATPPTGHAYVGSGTSTDDSGTVPDSNAQKIKIQHSGGIYRLVNIDTNAVLLTSTTDETFSIIKGRVYIDQAIYSSNQNNSGSGKVSVSDIFIALSDAAYCIKETDYGATTDFSVVHQLPASGAAKYYYFEYTCYVGAGWYGNVGILRTDVAGNKERVCLGDPAVSDGVTISTSRRPALSANRMYRGYVAIGSSYKSTGIGMATGTYVPVTLDGQDILLTEVAVNGTDTDCKTPLEQVTSPSNPFTGNVGRFVCLSASCPDTLPGVGNVFFSITISGAITLVPDVTDPNNPVFPSVSGVSIEGVACTLDAVTNGSQPYTCILSLQGWTSAAWGAVITVTSPDFMCSNAYSTGPGVIDTGAKTITFSNQSVTDVSVSESFKISRLASGCTP